MTRNQKIALGCGGAGCLGLIVVVIAAGVIYFLGYRQTNYDDSNPNSNVSTNRNSNFNDNSNSSENENSTSTSGSSGSAASMSEDAKHRLYQAAAMTGDSELLQRVSVKLGLMSEDYTPGDNYQQFLWEHAKWVFRNGDFLQSIDTQEKARAYVDEHMPT